MRIVKAFALCAGLSLAGSPAAAQILVVGGLVHERSARSGSEYEGSIGLKNDGGAPATVRLYMTDYHFSADGKTTFGDAGNSRRSNASWITLSTQSITVPPHQTSNIPYRVHVPAGLNDSTEGTYWSMAMIESEPTDARAGKPGSVEVRTVIRQGVQLVTHVGTSGSAVISFANLTAARDTSGAGLLRLDARNDGSRARRLLISVDLYSEAGELIASRKNQRGLVYPGCSIRQLFSLGPLPRGNYRAIIVADAGDDDLYATNIRVIF